MAAIIPDGWILNLIKNFISGLIGKVGYFVLIPALLYLFYVHAFSGSKPVVMRTSCTVSFLFICGFIAHLALNPALVFDGFGQLLSTLYATGIDGDSGGTAFHGRKETV